MKSRQRIFLVGCSGSGKSTLGKLLATEMGVEFASISPSAVYAAHGWTVAECFEDADKMRRVQAAIAPYTADELERRAALPGYVSDRAFDLSVYGALLGCCHPPDSIDRIIAAMHLSADGVPVRVTTVFVRPSARVLTAARLADAGRRAQFLEDPWVYRLDGALEYFIRTRGLAVAEIPPAVDDMNERLALIRQAAGLAPWSPLEPRTPIRAGFGRGADRRAATPR